MSHIDAKDSDIGATSGRADINDVKGELQLGMTSGRLTASFDTIESPVSFHMTSGSAKFNLPDDGDFNVQVKKQVEASITRMTLIKWIVKVEALQVRGGKGHI